MKQSKTLKNQRDMKRTIIRSNTQKRCQQTQQQSMQNRARSTLCELSENTYHSQVVDRKNLFFEKQGSPWKGQVQLENWDNFNYNCKARKDSKSVNNKSVKNSELDKITEDNLSFKKYTSIFAKIKEARLMKQSKNQEPSFNNTIIMQNKTVQNEGKQDAQSRRKVISSLYRKLKDIQEIKMKSLNRITSCCLIELQPKQQKSKVNKKQDKVKQDHWKKRNRSLKRKSFKKITQNAYMPEKAFKIQYKDSNPFTKILYDKYMKAVKILGDSKVHNFRFL